MNDKAMGFEAGEAFKERGLLFNNSFLKNSFSFLFDSRACLNQNVPQLSVAFLASYNKY
ncbi:MAG: hypothetical protein KME50_03765 [Nostoc desertorum CM1-VF14]|jgi:hypothetical protein|nr:hypothetical protein [Nostoc desertorum CM1-VF14]